MNMLGRLFHEPQNEKDDKITDTTLTRSIVISVVGILICLTCLFGLTWAWFSDSTIVGTNQITAATFDLEITVTEKDTENAVPKGEDGYYILEAEKTYAVRLAKQGTAKTGFCHLSVVTPTTETATAYYTDVIPYIDETTKEPTDPFVFFVTGVSKIKFTPMWGMIPEDQAYKIVPYGELLTPGTLFLTSQSPGDVAPIDLPEIIDLPDETEEPNETEEPEEPEVTEESEVTEPHETETAGPTDP